MGYVFYAPKMVSCAKRVEMQGLGNAECTQQSMLNACKNARSDHVQMMHSYLHVYYGTPSWPLCRSLVSGLKP
eukprot:1151889-Pelagomonas_calceolata.AAC.6